MENWQRLGTYAAGLALDDAGIKGDEALCSTMDMIVAAGGGERDEAVDQAILDAAASRNDRDVLLNEKLTTELGRRFSWRSSPTCSPATSPSSTR